MRAIIDRLPRAYALAKTRTAQFETDERGSLMIFSLFLFVLILLMAGMAVDVMRYESERQTLQNTVDSAILAASSLTQDADSDEEVIALVKEYVSKAGYDPDMVTVVPDLVVPAGGTIATSRSVSASIDFNMDTMFMRMLGIDTLVGNTSGAAKEGQQLIEIALVLDISGSMGNNNKMANLQSAAREFVTTVLANGGESRTSISIIPYNQQVYMDAELMSRLNLDDRLVNVPGPKSPGKIEEYRTRNPAAPCARFYEDDFVTRRLASANAIDVSASFVDDYFYWAKNGKTNRQYEQPYEFSFWCGSDNPTMLLYQNNEAVLHAYINGLTAYGATAIDYGMNWAVGILDPSFEPIVADMVDDGLLVEQMRGHPVRYDEPDVLKYVVLMTDGQNTDRFDLKDDYKSGPTRIWYSESLAGRDEFDGYLVEMPDNPSSRRWYVPGDPDRSRDDYYLAQNALPADAQQWDFHQLYRRFRTNDVADYFFRRSDSTAYDEYRDVVDDVGGYGTADANLKAICDTAKANAAIEVFTVAFEAPSNGEDVLKDCATNVGNYFDVDGIQISVAFNSIATQISQLRLTE